MQQRDDTVSRACYQGQLADGRCVAVTVAGRTIDAVETIEHDRSLPYLLPVLVDLQQNGALGKAFTTIPEHGADALHDIATLLRRHGVGRCLPTLVTYSLDGLRETLGCLDRWLSQDDDLASIFIGLFNEGVYISPEDGWRGIHAKRWIRPPDWSELAELNAAGGNRIRMVNVAPEEPGGLDFIEQAAAAGMVVSIGHCCPDAATVHAAADRGASVVTHFGNGAATEVHRFRNPFWAMLSESRLRCSLIADGFHLPPDLVAAAMACKGEDGCYFVSDAGFLSGCPPGEYRDPTTVDCVIEPNGHMHEAGNERLAGAWFQADRAVEFLVQTQGLELPEAWRFCSALPAAIIGEPLPAIEPGGEASFVLARWDEGLLLEQSVHHGRPYLEGPIRTTDCGLGKEQEEQHT